MGRTIIVAALLGLVAAVNAPLIEGWLAAAGQHVRVIAFTAAAMMCVVLALMTHSGMRTVVRCRQLSVLLRRAQCCTG